MSTILRTETILHGRQFLICDGLGDVCGEGPQGLFAHDTRHLSHWRLLVDGVRPQPLGEAHGGHHERRFYQYVPASGRRHASSLLLERHIVLGSAMLERITLTNVSMEPVSCELRIEVASDFDDLFSVKRRTFEEIGDDTGDVGLRGGAVHHEEARIAAAGPLAACTGEDARCTISASCGFDVREGALCWHVSLEPRERWRCDVRVDWDEPPQAARNGGGAEAAGFDAMLCWLDEERARWLDGLPALSGGFAGLERTWRTSLEDLHALHVDDVDAGPDDRGMLPAAGLPWFMTPFGRDSIITCLQSMVLGPDRVRSAIAFLAKRQATTVDDELDAHPGKILHEVREGAIARRGYGTYYGSVDATPLFLVLLHELYRWTGDAGFVRAYWPNARAALDWVRRWGDSNGDGYIDYLRRSSQGLDNQSWKDSWDSQLFRDGRMAEAPIAPAEAQGYAYDALLRTARLAHDVIGDEQLATALEEEATLLRARFNRDFWVTAGDVGADDVRAGGWFALALDADGERVDALTSNIGHLLWSGIVEPARVDAVVRQLASPALFSGWGIRTMSTLDRGYDPISYHDGTVWPHDTSICVAGLARAGAHREAAAVARGMLDAAVDFHGRLPEVFAGLDRSHTGHPVEYPTSSSPQAWAAATPVFLLTTLLGLQPNPAARELRSVGAQPPDWLEGLVLSGIEAFAASWSARVRDGSVEVRRDR